MKTHIEINIIEKSKLGAFSGVFLFIVCVLFLLDKVFNDQTHVVFLIGYIFAFSLLGLLGIYFALSGFGFTPFGYWNSVYISIDNEKIKFKIDSKKNENIKLWSNVKKISFYANCVKFYCLDNEQFKISYEKLTFKQVTELKDIIKELAQNKNIDIYSYMDAKNNDEQKTDM